MTDSKVGRIALYDGEFEKYKGTEKVRKEVKVCLRKEMSGLGDREYYII